ncbi:hypothetical protein [Bradyrhizobium sp. SYSU BS000235]|uniref:hypothetical protein n=1 Tax=Bradyrhizobium sp. SYSU BS000235 TaxID=3411332 RepID=UPI003C78B0A1
MAMTHALFVLSSVTVALAAGNAQAQSIPPEGPVSVTFTATQTSPVKPMPIGNGKEFMVINQAMTASNDAGNPILHNMGGRCLFSRLADSSAKTVELHGFCNYVDKDGDQIFEQCNFLPGAPNNCNVVGGTGKFENLQASLVISVTPLKSNYEGITQVVGHKKGTYKIVKTN